MTDWNPGDPCGACGSTRTVIDPDPTIGARCLACGATDADETGRPIPPPAATFIERGHPEGTCQRCGGPNVCWYAPSHVWNAVLRPAGLKPDLYSIVCPTCFAALATAAGVGHVWALRPDPDPAVRGGPDHE